MANRSFGLDLWVRAPCSRVQCLNRSLTQRLSIFESYFWNSFSNVLYTIARLLSGAAVAPPSRMAESSKAPAATKSLLAGKSVHRAEKFWADLSEACAPRVSASTINVWEFFSNPDENPVFQSTDVGFIIVYFLLPSEGWEPSFADAWRIIQQRWTLNITAKKFISGKRPLLKRKDKRELHIFPFCPLFSIPLPTYRSLDSCQWAFIC